VLFEEFFKERSFLKGVRVGEALKPGPPDKIFLITKEGLDRWCKELSLLTDGSVDFAKYLNVRVGDKKTDLGWRLSILLAYDDYVKATAYPAKITLGLLLSSALDKLSKAEDWFKGFVPVGEAKKPGPDEEKIAPNARRLDDEFDLPALLINIYSAISRSAEMRLKKWACDIEKNVEGVWDVRELDITICQCCGDEFSDEEFATIGPYKMSWAWEEDVNTLDLEVLNLGMNGELAQEIFSDSGFYEEDGIQFSWSLSPGCMLSRMSGHSVDCDCSTRLYLVIRSTSLGPVSSRTRSKTNCDM
jgi:hypothetical protein